VTLEAPMRCSTLAEELDEPMIGSVDQRARWLLVEDRSAWGHDAVGDVLGKERAGILKAREMAVRAIDDLDDIPLDEVTDARLASFGARMTDPIFLVCTNGKRDACCALRGRALTAAIAVDHGEWTWECTHLGGHRFAANLVCLPDGIVYGRVTASDGPRLADAYLERRVEAALLRGRSAWPAPAQVAEQTLRLRLEIAGLDDVRLLDAEVEANVATIRLGTLNGAEHAIELVRESADRPRPTSCRADELETPMHWRVTGSTV
jgi:hypothetical protein